MKINTKSFRDERYYCSQCDKKISEEQVNTETWCCDECGKKIRIDIETADLVRLLPTEMTKYDDVYDQYEMQFHSLKGITHEYEKYKFGISGFGSLTFNQDEFINCRWNDQ